MKDYQKVHEDYLHYTSQVEKLEKQLSNPGFLSKAKPDMIAASKQKLHDFTLKLNSLPTAFKACIMQHTTLCDDMWIEFMIQHEREIDYLIERDITIEQCNFDDDYFKRVYAPINTNDIFLLVHYLNYLHS